MIRRLLVVSMALVLGMTILGCSSKNPTVDKAPPATPKDLGTADKIPMDSPQIVSNSYWLVKTQVSGETRVFVLDGKVPGGEVAQWDAATKIFHNKSRSMRYDMNGMAKHEKRGVPGVPMQLKKVTLDSNNHVILNHLDSIKMEDRENPDVGAYIVVP